MLKIATYNIDWASTYKKKNNISSIELLLNSSDFDILIVTESVQLNLNFPYSYTSEKIPSDGVFEELDYGKYLNQNGAYRVIIYSKHEAVKILKVTDNYTSLALQFDLEIGQLNIYATIIGTWFNKLPFAKTELDNCINDCVQIFETYKSVCLIGDLNTSFCSDSKYHQINKFTTDALKKLAADTEMEMCTSIIEHNIDHIFIPKKIVRNFKVSTEVFIEKGLSDHPGIVLNIHTSANSG